MASVPEWCVEREAFAGPEPVQGDREVVDTDLGHRFLQKGKFVIAICNWLRLLYAEAVVDCKYFRRSVWILPHARDARSTPPSRCSATRGRCLCCATSCSATAGTSAS